MIYLHPADQFYGFTMSIPIHILAKTRELRFSMSNVKSFFYDERANELSVILGT